MNTLRATWRKHSFLTWNISCLSLGTISHLWRGKSGCVLGMSGTGSTSFSFTVAFARLFIDLKLGKFTHADAGQMNLYLNYAREHWLYEGEDQPIGLILCSERNEAVAHYALSNLSNTVLAREYRLRLPSVERLADELTATRRALLTRASVEHRIGESKPESREIHLLNRSTRDADECRLITPRGVAPCEARLARRES
jgi:hypothetical protein